jgi:hypothetical protein
MGLSVKIRLIRVIRVPFWMRIFVSRLFSKNEPQMNADERRFVAPGMCLDGRGAGSLRLEALDVEVFENISLVYFINVSNLYKNLSPLK